MLALKQFRSKAKGLPDLLNWAALIDDGVVLNKDGSLLAGFFYRGPDIASSTPAERNHLTARVNAALTRLAGDGWVTWQDAARLSSAAYPDRSMSYFPDPITRLIDEERRAQFLAEGEHFECEYALTLQYMPPLRRNTRVADMVYDDSGEKTRPADRILAQFKHVLAEVEDTLGTVIQLRRMGSYSVHDRLGREHLRDELLNYLQFCLTGESIEINVPPAGMYLDSVLGGRELWPGDMPKLGKRYLACVAIEGFPAESYPGILDVLDHLAIPFRWSSRFIYLDAIEASKHLKSFRRKWKQKERGLVSQVFKTPGGVINEDAVQMTREVEAAMSDANSGLVSYGFYTPVVVLMAEDRDLLIEQARTVSREVQRQGFVCRTETVNTMEAWLGSLPGHPIPNIRRPLIHSLNLADLLPLASVWPGHEECPCPFYPRSSPPLLHAATTGATPFRVNLHVGDTGATLMLGPPGAGKSTLLALLAAQFRRYPNATIWAFDKGRSLMPLTLAAGGQHYNIAAEGSRLAFCPLGQLDSDLDIAWAEEWLAACFELQSGHRPSVAQIQQIHRAVKLMSSSPMRSLTDFTSTIQDLEIRDAIAHYTVDGALGHLLDSRKDGLVSGDFQVFEIEELMDLGERNILPVLLYLFRRFAQALKGQPALLILDEAWIVLSHPVFRAKIVEWLKVLRKANCIVIIATQSLSDLAKSGILDVLQESCPTKIFLPNIEADKEGANGIPGPRDLYATFGLNDKQIEIIKTATRKRHYYFTSPEGRRLVDLGLGPVALSFVGASDKKQLATIESLVASHQDKWPFEWLKQRKVDYAQYI